MSGRLAGVRAVVTGAGSGIGRATAVRLARDGAAVFGVDRAGEAELILDVTEPHASARIVAAAAGRMGGIEAVVPCAGIVGQTVLDRDDNEQGDEHWDAVLAVNVTAVFRLVRAALPALRASGRGRIVTIGSVMSSFGAPGLVAYAASKHAVLGMTRALAAELGRDAITANCVQPGAIETAMTAAAFEADPAFAAFWTNKAALGRLGRPDDIADVIAFLLSDDARFVSGQGILIDGGAMQQP